MQKIEPKEIKEFRLAFHKGKHQFFYLYDTTAQRFLSSIGRSVDPSKIEDEVEVDPSTTFDKQHIEAVVEFYSDSDWNPRVIEKVWSNRLADYDCTEAEYMFILRCSDHRNFAKLYECACFFNLQAAKHLCFLVVGSRVLYNQNDLTTLQTVALKLGISDPLDHIRTSHLQKKYEFLNNPPSISEDSESCEEEFDNDEAEEEDAGIGH